MKSKQEVIRDYIFKEMYFNGDEGKLEYDTPLLGDVIDSMGLQMLLPFLETEFDLTIPDDELLPDNFETINSVCLLLERIQGEERD